VLLPVEVAERVAHPDVAGTVYVGVYSFAAGPNPQGQLLVSKDRGATWEELTDVSVGGGLLFSPPARDRPPYTLYSGCADGLCRSRDGGQAWETVPGVPGPLMLAAGTDGARTVVYLGSSGGIAAPVRARAVGAQAAPREELLEGGVYRLVARLPDEFVYLPVLTSDP
jgi:hypothetical protein